MLRNREEGKELIQRFDTLNIKQHIDIFKYNHINTLQIIKIRKKSEKPNKKYK